jgi:hypothetical protein
VEFLLGCYEVIEEYLRRVVESSIREMKNLDAFNTTFRVIIHEDDNLASFKKFNQSHYVIAFIKSYQRLLQEE